jgi:hypothetical protein
MCPHEDTRKILRGIQGILSAGVIMRSVFLFRTFWTSYRRDVNGFSRALLILFASIFLASILGFLQSYHADRSLLLRLSRLLIIGGVLASLEMILSEMDSQEEG